MKPHLEKTTEAFIEALTAKGGKPIYQLTPDEARDVLETLQKAPVEKLAVETEEKKLPVGPSGFVSVTIYRPEGALGKLPVIMFYHGAGWVMGSSSTHDRLVRELVVRSHAAAVFVNYSRSPEVKFPVAIEESYAATKYVAEHGEALHLDTSRMVAVGDSVGGNMAIAMTLLAKQRSGPKFDLQILFYPVTCAEMNTPSYSQFSEGPWLTKPAMEWFWNAYQPDLKSRKDILLSPLLANVEELKGLPSAVIITAENDVLRDEGEAYAAKLMDAGVTVTATRFLGTIHDFVMLHALAKTHAAESAISLAVQHLKESFQKQSKPKRKAA